MHRGKHFITFNIWREGGVPRHVSVIQDRGSSGGANSLQPLSVCVCASAGMSHQLWKLMCGTADVPSQVLTSYLRTTRYLSVDTLLRSGQRSFNLLFIDHQAGA